MDVQIFESLRTARINFSFKTIKDVGKRLIQVKFLDFLRHFKTLKFRQLLFRKEACIQTPSQKQH